jgi:hypothetical protein
MQTRDRPKAALWRRLIGHLLLWAFILLVEFGTWWLLGTFGVGAGLSEIQIRMAHEYLSWILFCTLCSTATCVAGEVVAVGLRNCLEEFYAALEPLGRLIHRVRALGKEDDA